MATLRFLIFDDHEIFAVSLGQLLTRSYDPCVIECESGDVDVVKRVAGFKPDLVFMDLQMPHLDGVEATKALHAALPEVKVLAVSALEDASSVRAMMSAGAAGYLCKNDSVDRLELAIDTILEGNVYLSPEMLKVVVNAPPDGGDARVKSVLDILTAREREVFRLIADGLSSKQAGSELGISVKTIDTHRKNIMDKLGFDSLADWIRTAIREGVIELD